METRSIMIVGVGGQGSLLASRLLGNVLLAKGLDVKVSEVHGMSQRGGSVVTYVRYGDEVCSPIIEKGEADVIISFELLESARWLPYLKKGGKLITTTQQLDPMPVITGAAQYLPCSVSTVLTPSNSQWCSLPSSASNISATRSSIKSISSSTDGSLTVIGRSFAILLQNVPTALL